MERYIKSRYLGIALAIVATLFFTTMDSIAKHLVQTYSVVNITCIRYVIQVGLIVLIFGPRHGKDLLVTKKAGPQVIRGLLVVAISLSFFTSLKYLPIAEATAITFLSPVLTVVLALVLLKEKITGRICAALLLGIVGVTAIIKPGIAVFSWAITLPILTAILYSVYEVLTKKVSDTELAYSSLFYSTVVGGVVSGLILPFTWEQPSIEQLFFLSLLSMVGLLAHYSLILALQYTTVSSIQPYHFLSLLWASLAGYWIFDEALDGFSILGMLIIVLSGFLALEWGQVVAIKNNQKN